MAERIQKLRAVLLLFAVFSILWLAWVFLLLHFPAWSGGGIRAAVRLILWLGAALVFVRWHERQPFLEHVKLTGRMGPGLAWGGSAAAILLLPAIGFRFLYSRQAFHWPGDISIWLNPILTAPLCEEVLFRGVIFQALRIRLPFLPAAAISALLFALIHWPYWALSGSAAGLGLAAGLGGVFLQGLTFAGLLELSQSLWAPLLFHGLNNFVGQSFR